ncbi:MAG: hypothetical protein ACREM1_20020 [Longimicrobiales bacterium]
MNVEFEAAVDRLTRAVTHEDIAVEAGVSTQLIRQARLDRSASSYRNPPTGWHTAVAKLARKRPAELARLADELEREKG